MTKSISENFFETYIKCSDIYINLLLDGKADFTYFAIHPTPMAIMVSLYTMLVARKELVPLTEITTEEKRDIFNDSKEYWPGADRNNLTRMSICIYLSLKICESYNNKMI